MFLFHPQQTCTCILVTPLDILVIRDWLMEMVSYGLHRVKNKLCLIHLTLFLKRKKVHILVCKFKRLHLRVSRHWCYFILFVLYHAVIYNDVCFVFV